MPSVWGQCCSLSIIFVSKGFYKRTHAVFCHSPFVLIYNYYDLYPQLVKWFQIFCSKLKVYLKLFWEECILPWLSVSPHVYLCSSLFSALTINSSAFFSFFNMFYKIDLKTLVLTHT